MRAIKPLPDDYMIVENNPQLIRLEHPYAIGKLVKYLKKQKKVLVRFPWSKDPIMLDLSQGKFIIRRRIKERKPLIVDV